MRLGAAFFREKHLQAGWNALKSSRRSAFDHGKDTEGLKNFPMYLFLLLIISLEGGYCRGRNRFYPKKVNSPRRTQDALQQFLDSFFFL